MDELHVRAPAKINLFLKVLRKRPDGYHDIHSWFQAVDLCDELAFIPMGETGIGLEIEGKPDLPNDSENLVVRAAKLIFDRFKLAGGVRIRLKKAIPVSAGLGGGSSDVAATIYALSRLYGLELSAKVMQQLGLEIGSDVPFFFSTGQADISGRGEIVNGISLPVEYSIALVVPHISVSTAESYKQLSLSLTSPLSDVNLYNCSDFAELVAQIRDVGNDFENGHFKTYPILGEIRQVLQDAGAALTRMSGSGPAMFGLFEKMPEGEGASHITRGDWKAFFVHPITLPAWG
jgi:4-diphosphocytidyl-2-C-methyl-D-erythritol kinase